MEPSRYFYSTDGTDVHGPVTDDELRTLIQSKVVTLTSYLCREGETEWKPLNLEVLRNLLVPPHEPMSVATAAARARLRELKHSSRGRGPWRGIFKWTSWLVTFGTAIYIASDLGPNRSVSYTLGAFCGSLFVIVALPYIISGFFKGFPRVLVRSLGLLLTSFLALLVHLNGSWAQLEALSGEMLGEENADARKQIAEKGYDDGADQSQANAQKLKDQDSGDVARMVAIGASISQEILAKVKTCDSAEKTIGNVDPPSLDSVAAIEAARTAFTDLRRLQTDVLTYLQHYDEHFRTALVNGGFSGSAIDQFISGARKGGHIVQVTSIWQLRIKLSDDQIERLNFLEKTWGSWNTKDGNILFSNPDQLATYKALVANIQNDAKAMSDIEREIYQ